MSYEIEVSEVGVQNLNSLWIPITPSYLYSRILQMRNTICSSTKDRNKESGIYFAYGSPSVSSCFGKSDKSIFTPETFAKSSSNSLSNSSGSDISK